MHEDWVTKQYHFSRPGSVLGSQNGAFLEYLEIAARKKLNEQVPFSCLKSTFSRAYRLKRISSYKAIRTQLRTQTDDLFRRYDATRVWLDDSGENSHLNISGPDLQSISLKKTQLKRELKELLGLEVIF